MAINKCTRCIRVFGDYDDIIPDPEKPGKFAHFCCIPGMVEVDEDDKHEEMYAEGWASNYVT